MATPITASSFYVTEKISRISLGYPIAAFSIWNDGPNSVNVWSKGSGKHTIKISESIDVGSDYPITEFYAQTDPGETATIRFLGARKFIPDREQPTQITRVFNPPKEKAVYAPYQTNTSSPQIDPILLLCLIVLGIVATVCVAGMVISKK